MAEGITKITIPDQVLQDRFKLLQDMFPLADPDFLLQRVEAVPFDSEFSNLIIELTESSNYPTKKQFIQKKLNDSILNRYVTNFNIDNFCKEIPDPIAYFQKNQIKLPDPLYNYVLQNFLNFFPHHRKDVIVGRLKNHNNSIFDAYVSLAGQNATMKKTIRGKKTCEINDQQNLYDYESCFQLLVYLEHKQEIDEKFKFQPATIVEEPVRGTKHSHTIECQCCYETNISMYVSCKKGHEFCIECVRKSSELLIMEKKLTFPCLTACDSFFSDETINSVLRESTLQSLNTQRELAEIENAGLNGLEACIHCSFYQLVTPENKIFECLNSRCLRATCRQCLKDAHIPYKCEEVSEGAKRNYIENKMSEALISKCYKCGLNFVKTHGCNKICCPCGALMCYVCKKPIEDYSHFKEDGCPLYMNAKSLHAPRVSSARVLATLAFEKRFK